MGGWKILLVQRIHEVGERLLRDAGEVIVPADISPSGLCWAVPEVDALVVRTAPVPASVIQEGARLRVIGRHGVGVDNVDVPAATCRGIPVVYTPGAVTEPVAEHVVGLMIALAKRLGEGDRALRRGDFQARETLVGSELEGKTLGIVGLGNIGSRVGEICRGAFHMVLLAYDPYCPPERARRLGTELVDKLNHLLNQSDFVSLHAPLTSQTKGLIGASELAAMKPSAYLINTGRGGLVDEAALIEALHKGTIAGAGLDVFAHEPPSPQSPLFQMDNVVVTPHMASHTEEGLRRMALTVAQEVLTVLRGDRPRYVANPEVYMGDLAQSDLLLPEGEG